MRFSQMRPSGGNTTKRYVVTDRDTQALLEYEGIHGKMRPKPILRPLGGPLRPITMRKAAQLRELIATPTLLAAPREVVRPRLRRMALMLVANGTIIRPGRACDQTPAVDQSHLPQPRVGRRRLPHAKTKLPTQSPIFPEQILRSKRRKPRLGIPPDDLATPRALPA